MGFLLDIAEFLDILICRFCLLFVCPFIVPKAVNGLFIAFFYCCFFGGFSSISSGDGRLYFWSVFLILQMNNLSSSFEFSITQMNISFSMDESSLAKVVNKIVALLSSVVSIGSAPISV